MNIVTSLAVVLLCLGLVAAFVLWFVDGVLRGPGPASGSGALAAATLTTAGAATLALLIGWAGQQRNSEDAFALGLGMLIAVGLVAMVGGAVLAGRRSSPGGMARVHDVRAVRTGAALLLASLFAAVAMLAAGMSWTAVCWQLLVSSLLAQLVAWRLDRPLRH